MNYQEQYHLLIEENKHLKDVLAAAESQRHPADKLNTLIKVKSIESLSIFKELEGGKFVQDTFKYNWRESEDRHSIEDKFE